MKKRRITRKVRLGIGVLAATLSFTSLPAAADRTGTTASVGTRSTTGSDGTRDTTRPSSTIPVTGWGDARLQPVVDALLDFMRHRCVGAASLAIAYKGVPLGEWGFGRTNGRATEGIADPDCGDDATDPYDPAASNVDHRTPMRIGSISKGITAAVTRWTIKKAYNELTGATLTDDELEALRLFGDDFPVPLTSDRLQDLYRGEEPLGPLASCDGAGGSVDPDWQDVDLRHLLAHRAGIPGGLDDESEVTPHLPYLRGLVAADDFQAEHEAARAAAPDVAAFDAARAELQGDGPGTVHFLRPQTMEDRLAVLAGYCVKDNYGIWDYSNTGPQLVGAVARHLVASKRFSADVGAPATHEGSALQLFFEQELGLQTYANSGAFQNQSVHGLSGHTYTTPRSRSWKAGQGTYYSTAADGKRPHCRLVRNQCDTSEWVNGPRANWLYGFDSVPADRAGPPIGAPQGGLNIEPRFMLEFMRRFWVGGYDAQAPTDSFNPWIGEPRNDVWNRWTMHNGENGNGSRAWAAQFGGTAWNFLGPPAGPDGRLVDDYTNLVNYNINPPAGLDVFVAVNQNADRKCVLAGSCPYGALNGAVAYGLSQVDWAPLTDPIDNPEEPATGGLAGSGLFSG